MSFSYTKAKGVGPWKIEKFSSDRFQSMRKVCTGIPWLMRFPIAKFHLARILSQQITISNPSANMVKNRARRGITKGKSWFRIARISIFA